MEFFIAFVPFYVRFERNSECAYGGGKNVRVCGWKNHRENVTFAAVLVFAFYLGCTDDSVGMETLAISDEKKTFLRSLKIEIFSSSV